ncbi:hypothetical protein JZ751_004172 [Albula glossodonta]|uniref:Uncharacterized protein n=1 Tax=Albula glossodonta TaxID=121402 RepID=A0A8T2N625_9TELE|nr:hypothetical protein JZ751_004172 [Albula glossodonta]
MPVVQSGSVSTPHDQSVREALELFCSASEQTYEAFLASFPHLSTGDVAGGGMAALSPGQLPFRESEGRSRDGAEERDRRTVREQDNTKLLVDQEEVANLWISFAPLRGGPTLLFEAEATVGRWEGRQPRPPGKVKLDNYLDLTDFNQHEDDAQTAVEVEEDPPAYVPSFSRQTQLELRTCPERQPRQGQPSPASQTDSAEVQPFSLDENFDYDHVVLSRKHPVP